MSANVLYVPVVSVIMLNTQVALNESCVCYAIDKEAEKMGGWEPGYVSK